MSIKRFLVLISFMFFGSFFISCSSIEQTFEESINPNQSEINDSNITLATASVEFENRIVLKVNCAFTDYLPTGNQKEIDKFNIESLDKICQNNNAEIIKRVFTSPFDFEDIENGLHLVFVIKFSDWVDMKNAKTEFEKEACIEYVEVEDVDKLNYPPDIVGSGQVEYLEIEGGIFVIRADSGKRYETYPQIIHAKNGEKVYFEADFVYNMVSCYMVGEIIRLRQIKYFSSN